MPTPIRLQLRTQDPANILGPFIESYQEHLEGGRYKPRHFRGAWRPELHGVMQTAMAAFKGKQLTADGFEFAFALQYFASVVLNRRLVDRLAASGDGRIVHIAGNAPASFNPP